jgi:hypothetical protein
MLGAHKSGPVSRYLLPSRRGFLLNSTRMVVPYSYNFSPCNSPPPKTCPSMGTRDLQLIPNSLPRPRRPSILLGGEGSSMGEPLPTILSPRGARPSPQISKGALILYGPCSLAIPLPKAHLAATSSLLYRPSLADHVEPRLGLSPGQTLPSCGGQSDSTTLHRERAVAQRTDTRTNANTTHTPRIVLNFPTRGRSGASSRRATHKRGRATAI